MGLQYKTVKAQEITGMICDKCGKQDINMFNDFAVHHTMGYDSSRDMDSVSFTLCDNCLEQIVTESIPSAVWRDSFGKEIK
jgi:hypothetical protein